MSSTTTRSPAPRPSAAPRPRRTTLLDDVRPEVLRSAIDGAPTWVSGVLSALQGALLSLLCLVLPALAAFVATSADPTNDGVPWTRAAHVGASVWLLAHGVPTVVAGVPVTLVPLGVTALALFTAWASARRSGTATRAAHGAGTATYAAATLLVALLVGASGTGLLLAVLGGALVGGAGTGLGLLARPGARPLREVTRPAWRRVPAPLRVGATGAVLATALLVLVAALLTVVWVVGSMTTVADVVRALGLDAVGGGVLAVAQLAFLPDLVLWNLAWAAGPGFAVGAGTTFSPLATVTGPLPAVPMLGALPTPDLAGTPGVLPLLLVVAVGALAGLHVHRRLVVERARDLLLALAGLAVAVVLLVAGLVRASAGAVGPGRLTDVGGDPWAVGGAAAGLVLLGAVLAAAPAEPRVRAWVRGVVAGAVERVRPCRATPAEVLVAASAEGVPGRPGDERPAPPAASDAVDTQAVPVVDEPVAGPAAPGPA
nr:DUF6350 family protein [Cellulomonas endophytica]